MELPFRAEGVVETVLVARFLYPVADVGVFHPQPLQPREGLLDDGPPETPPLVCVVRRDRLELRVGVFLVYPRDEARGVDAVRGDDRYVEIAPV